MSVSYWILWLVLCAAGIALSVWQYRRRETPGRGRGLLAALRSVTLALLLLLLLDPRLPAGGSAPGGGTRVLLDASLSMSLPAAADGGVETRWERAVARARALGGNTPVLLFGETVRPTRPDELPETAPADARTLLLPALQAAAEAGVRRVVVITDGGIEDADAVARWLPRLGLELETESVAGELRNRALVEVSAPGWVEAGTAAGFEFGIAASGMAADSVHVIARQGDRVIGRTAVSSAAVGRIATGRLELRLQAPPDGGWVPVELALEGADDVAGDDVRTVYVHVTAEPAGIALVSFRPDWEPRFLAPVLEQALGLPLRAWLRGATGQYVRLAGGLEAGAVTAEADVRAAVDRAELIVLHGLGTDAPAWAVEAAAGGRPVLIFPGQGAADGAIDDALPMTVGAEQEGDFFPAATVPASPVAPLLVGLDLTDTSPLAGLRPAAAPPPGAWAPLLATRGRQGATLPIVLAGSDARRRWVVALGSGYWQWAFRGGAERQLYARLWSSLAGWLMRDQPSASFGALRPARLALPRGRPIPWVTAGPRPDSLAITLTGPDGAVALDTVATPAAGDTTFTLSPPPGEYAWRARAFLGEDELTAAGALTIERYSPELARSPVDLQALASPPDAVRGESATSRGRGTPLHAVPYAYVLLVLLLAGEWVLRRRWGLR